MVKLTDLKAHRSLKILVFVSSFPAYRDTDDRLTSGRLNLSLQLVLDLRRRAFGNENFGTKLWAEDDDGVFITKVALLSLAVASGVRGMSLSLSPAFDPTDGAWRECTNVVAFTIVALPLTLNVEKWKNRERVVLARNALSAVYASVVEETGARANEESTKRTERATVAREDNY